MLAFSKVCLDSCCHAGKQAGIYVLYAPPKTSFLFSGIEMERQEGGRGLGFVCLEEGGVYCCAVHTVRVLW